MGIIYTKPNGMDVEINEKSVAYVESLGWKKAPSYASKSVKKRVELSKKSKIVEED